jgi:hypothetical protein
MICMGFPDVILIWFAYGPVSRHISYDPVTLIANLIVV